MKTRSSLSAVRCKLILAAAVLSLGIGLILAWIATGEQCLPTIFIGTGYAAITYTWIYPMIGSWWLRRRQPSGLLSPDFHPDTFSNSLQKSATEAMHGSPISISGREYLTVPNTKAARQVRSERKVVNMSDYGYQRRRNPVLHAGEVVYLPSSHTGRRL